MTNSLHAASRFGVVMLAVLGLLACGSKQTPLAESAVETKASQPAPVQPAVHADARAPHGELRRAPACSYMTAAEVSEILQAPIGKAAEKDSDRRSSCAYPPFDMTSYQQAQVDIDWQAAGTTTLEDTMAKTFGGNAVGSQVAHQVQLGDSSSYSREGILRIHAGNALISITLMMRPDSEQKAVALGTLLLGRMGYAQPAAAPTSAASFHDDSPLVPGVVLADDCPGTDASQKAAFAKSAEEDKTAIVPLKVGVTWAHTWTEGETEPKDHECLEQVTEVTQDHVDMTMDCEMRDGSHQHNRRRVCRQDLAESHTFHPETWEGAPRVISPATLSSLSSKALRELKATGSTQHHWLEIAPHPTRAEPLHIDVNTTLMVTPDAPKSYSILINDKLVTVPVIRSSSKKGGDSDDDDDGVSPFVKHLQDSVLSFGPADEDRSGTGINTVFATTLDDERFPLILDYEVPGRNYRLKLTKITYGAEPEMEKQLAAKEPVTIYGIYFDFASDKLRAESRPVLEEIAAIMAKNPDWKLSVTGHTDGVGGAASNLDLSKRRAAAVKTALVEHYQVAAARLATDGAGAGAPQDTNETPEGRARNRRVVLRRE